MKISIHCHCRQDRRRCSRCSEMSYIRMSHENEKLRHSSTHYLYSYVDRLIRDQLEQQRRDSIFNIMCTTVTFWVAGTQTPRHSMAPISIPIGNHGHSTNSNLTTQAPEKSMKWKSAPRYMLPQTLQSKDIVNPCKEFYCSCFIASLTWQSNVRRSPLLLAS